jgi:heme oxygenase
MDFSPIDDFAPIARGIRHVLRSETADDHERLHRMAAFDGLATGDMSRARYCDLMLGLHGFHAGFEVVAAETLALVGPAFPEHGLPPRGALLAADLARLGVAVDRDRPPPLLPRPTGPEALAGMFYVVDGSMLGAAVLEAPARRIAGAEGAGYWRWCREHGAARWRSLCGLLAAVCDDPARQAGAVEAARATFRAFEAIVSAHGRAEPGAAA